MERPCTLDPLFHCFWKINSIFLSARILLQRHGKNAANWQNTKMSLEEKEFRAGVLKAFQNNAPCG